MALRGRIRKLESDRAQELTPEEQALAMASPAEKRDLWRHFQAGEAGRPEFLRLWEEILGRVSPVLAGDVRCERDLLHRKLEELREEWEARGRRHSTSQSDPAFWNLANAEVNRMHALQLGLTHVIEDEAEVMKILETVVNPDTEVREIWQIVGRT